MELKKIFFLSLLCFILSCSEDTEDWGNSYAYYTLVNKSDYDIRLKYNERDYDYKLNKYDTIIKIDSSYIMEIRWDIFGPPFHWTDTLYVEYDDNIKFYDYSSNFYFNMILFSKSSKYIFTEETEHIRRATYTITNEDYEYSKQKLAEREARNGGD